MSSTRTAKDDSVYHQGRYASAPEFDPGLIASLVARRCSVLRDPAERELIWFIHHLSHRAGGIKQLVQSLLTTAGVPVGTKAMARIGKGPGENFTAEEVKLIRGEMPEALHCLWPVKGELVGADCRHPRTHCPIEREERRRKEELERQSHPDFYPVQSLIDLCEKMAREDDALECHLMDLCLDPGVSLRTGWPWYFARLDQALKKHLAQFKAAAADGVVITELGREVFEMLDRTLEGGAVALLEGNARTGKTFAARVWCAQHPGRARFIEVPVGNDDSSFYRALARGLGLGNFSQAKAVEMRERVESVLLTGDLMVVLDEAHYLWPQRNRRYASPGRISWVMSMANQGVSFCLISTPQFLQQQKQMEVAGWNSAQFNGRVLRYKSLPGGLSANDLQAVARAVLPEADTRTLKAIAIYAATSSRYLAAIESIAEEARFLAGRQGRNQATAADVAAAMSQCVIPSDTGMVNALKAAERPVRGRGQRPVDLAGDVAADLAPMPGATRPAVSALDADFTRREVSPMVQPLEVAA